MKQEILAADTLNAGRVKINSNFTELYQQRFWFTKVLNLLNIPITYTPVAQVTVPAPSVVGTYMVAFAIQYTFADIANSVLFRFSIDGGTSWTEFSVEKSDTTNSIPLYGFPKDFTGGAINLQLQARKEGGAIPFNIEFADVFINLVQPSLV